MRDHIIERILNIAEHDPRIMLLVGDLGFNVVEKFAQSYPERYINCGIAEGNMMSVAAGLAIEGNIVFAYSIGNFLTLRCLEQIRNDVCYHRANVKIIAVGGGVSYGTLGMSHHSTEDLAVMRSMPYMRVYAPADPIEAIAAIQDIYLQDGPCYIRLAKGKDDVLHKEIELKTITKLQGISEYEYNNPDVAIITTGTILSEAINTMSRLEAEGIRCALYSCPTIKPLDTERIKSIADTTKLIVSVEEHNIIGGLGGAIAETLSIMRNHAPLLRIGLNDTFTEVVGSRDYLRRYYQMDSDKITKRIIELLKAG